MGTGRGTGVGDDVRDVAGDDVWDVVVVGAGPAGSSAAVAALRSRPDARVLLLDRSDFPRDKACGDGVDARAVAELASLGVPDPTAGYAPVRRLRLHGPRGAVVEQPIVPPARTVPRRVLDARILAAALDAGAAFRRHTVRTLEVRGDRVVLDGSLAARVVVGADGANGVVRRLLGLAANPPEAMAVAIRAYAPVPTHAVGEQVIALDPERWPAYAWSFPIGDGRANVGYGAVLAGGTPSRRELLAGLHRLVPGVVGLAEARAHHLPLSTRRPRQPDGRVLLAGDAASLINPFTGEGIFYAVVSGASAGRAALLGASAGRAHRHTMARRLGRHLRHTTRLARFSGSTVLAEAVVRGGGRDSGAFADLVELGMADGLVSRRLLAASARALPGALRTSGVSSSSHDR